MKQLNPIVSKLITELRSLPSEAKVRATPAQPCVLVIEDNRFDAELMTMACESAGCVVTVAATGEDALTVFTTSMRPEVPSFDLVFLDLNLPKMDGVSVFKRIRAISSNMPVVLITSPINEPAIREAAKLGYVTLIEKPLNRDGLDQILTQHRIPFQPGKDSVAD